MRYINLRLGRDLSFQSRLATPCRRQQADHAQGIVSEMGEGGFNEKVGPNERSIQIHDQWL
jgi:hypothetical protein